MDEDAHANKEVYAEEFFIFTYKYTYSYIMFCKNILVTVISFIFVQKLWCKRPSRFIMPRKSIFKIWHRVLNRTFTACIFSVKPNISMCTVYVLSVQPYEYRQWFDDFILIWTWCWRFFVSCNIHIWSHW